MMLSRVLLAGSLLFSAHAIWANSDVTSREYKLTLDSSQFTYQSENDNVVSLVDAAGQAIEQAIERSVSGTPVLEHERQVRYFDTSSSCQLEHMGYSFRERVEDGQSEVTLKFRSADRYISDFEDVSSPDKDAESKLESDIGRSDIDSFIVRYGHSTKLDNDRTINRIDDISAHFPGIADDHPIDEDAPLAVVGDLTVVEHVYKDVFIDLGQFDAQISVTLWYQGSPSGNAKPLIAELSFRYEDPSADYTRKVVNRARQAFDAVNALAAWRADNQIGKTRFIYQYRHDFCGN